MAEIGLQSKYPNLLARAPLTGQQDASPGQGLEECARRARLTLQMLTGISPPFAHQAVQHTPVEQMPCGRPGARGYAFSDVHEILSLGSTT